MTKETIREVFLAKRRAISARDYSLLSHNLSEKFAAHFDMSSINVIHTYLPLTNNNEPDTWIIIDWLHVKFPELKISVPRINYDTEKLESVYFDNRFQLKKNKWGLEEPESGIVTDAQEIDLAIVPLLAFDSQGNRVGYGKGYYDKFLTTCRKNCKRVGLSFFEPVEKISDINQHDIPLNYCITPKRFFTF